MSGPLLPGHGRGPTLFLNDGCSGAEMSEKGDKSILSNRTAELIKILSCHVGRRGRKLSLSSPETETDHQSPPLSLVDTGL